MADAPPLLQPSQPDEVQIRTSEICSNISVLRKRIEYERYRIHLLEAKCRIRAREHRRRLTYDPPEFIDENDGPHRPSNENGGEDSRTPLPLPLLLGYDDTLSTDAVLADHAEGGDSWGTSPAEMALHPQWGGVTISSAEVRGGSITVSGHACTDIGGVGWPAWLGFHTVAESAESAAPGGAVEVASLRVRLHPTGDGGGGPQQQQWYPVRELEEIAGTCRTDPSTTQFFRHLASFAAFHERRCAKWKDLEHRFGDRVRLDVRSAEDLVMRVPEKIRDGTSQGAPRGPGGASFEIHLSRRWEIATSGIRHEKLRVLRCRWSDDRTCDDDLSKILRSEAHIKALVRLLGGVDGAVEAIVSAVAHASSEKWND